MNIFELQKKYHALPALDLEILLATTIKKEKEFIYSHPEYPISIIQYLRFCWFVHLYKKGYSVAAIIKHKEFYGLDFFVNKNVLIPRPETELMVESVVESLKSKVKSPITLVDIGTGSGCIPISILKNLPQPIPTYAIDISRRALNVAKKNARTHNVNIEFFRGNLLKPILKMLSGKIVITANLPYLTEQQFQQSPSIQKEPKIALTAKNNGLALYEELLQQIKTADLNGTILLEIDPSQSEMIRKIIKQNFSNANIETKKDLSGLDRLIKISVA